MSHWTTNTQTNRTCPLRRIVRVDSVAGKLYEVLECGHPVPAYFVQTKVKQRRCIKCRDGKSAKSPNAAHEAPE